ncbi:MAG: hypothetical protein KIS89_12285, partial [Dokdonella sp.]|nr:hypothetical protein [Dokdonella sp.]
DGAGQAGQGGTDDAVGPTLTDADDAPVDLTSDDGLQPDERGVSKEVAREKEARQRRDVILNEAAHILADEIDLVRADVKLAQQVLPHAVRTPLD